MPVATVSDKVLWHFRCDIVDPTIYSS